MINHWALRSITLVEAIIDKQFQFRYDYVFDKVQGDSTFKTVTLISTKPNEWNFGRTYKFETVE